MGIAKCKSAQLNGLSAEIIIIEVDISNGLNAISIVGLGDRAVDESKDRVSAAIKNSGYTSPKQQNQKVVVSLAPADLRKEGPSFDLAIAVAYLMASNAIHVCDDFSNYLFIGELALDGSLRRVSGLLPILRESRMLGFTKIFIPSNNASEAEISGHTEVYSADCLRDVIDHLEGKTVLKRLSASINNTGTPRRSSQTDISSIKGNSVAKRGLEIAASGGHNVILYGPPGTGKTMLAKSFPSILPDLSHEESMEVTSIYSVAKTNIKELLSEAPFRSPHHTSSYAAIVGGGAYPRPGEITLAHHGTLFLDEFPEFNREVLEALRQPLEEKTITISRARGSVTYPASCILIASMNPCPCGKPANKECRCTPSAIRNYERKVSGPIMDRIDIWLNVHKVEYDKLAETVNIEERSNDILSRVIVARERQRQRFKTLGLNKKYNSEIAAGEISMICATDEVSKSTLLQISKQQNISGRAFHRILKVARTIADLEDSEIIRNNHILEAFQYREQKLSAQRLV